MVQYGLTMENERIILEKAKSKKDGVYTFRGVGYRVCENHVTHFSDNGIILERAYGFNCIVGSFEGYNSNGLKTLKEI
jgi:hypothetical protein